MSFRRTCCYAGRLVYRTGLLTLLLASIAGAQIPVRVATFNIENFDGDEAQLEAARDVLLRIGADVVCVQEMRTATAFDDLADAAGYPFHTLAALDGAIDGVNRSGVMSVFPIVDAYSATSVLLSNDADAHDLVRNFIVATIDVPGAFEDLIVIGNHWKSGSGDSNEFRRSVESIRAMQAVSLANDAGEPMILLGDMNDDILDSADSPAQFFSVPDGVPISYELGNDIIFAVENSVFQPLLDGIGSSELTAVDPLQLDGSDATHQAGRRIDYIWVGQAVTIVASEVYDSDDEGLPGGLPKFGDPLASGASSIASDHLLVFTDLEVAIVPPDLSGACCFGGTTCLDSLDEEDCVPLGGVFYMGLTCDDPLDPPCEASEVVVVLNEVLATHDGTDDMEFIELFGTSFGSLAGLSIVAVEGETLSKGIVDLVIDLEGLILNADGYLTLGAEGIAPDVVLGSCCILEDGTQTLLLVRDLTADIGFDIDINNDGVADASIGQIVDSVGLADSGLGSSDAIYYDASVVGPDDGAFPAGGGRVPNGSDTDQELDWQILSRTLDGSDGLWPISPGGPNSPTPCEGDANDDGTVDPLDTGFILARFGCSVGTGDADCDAADQNGDGSVDPLDSGFVLSRFGICP